MENLFERGIAVILHDGSYCLRRNAVICETDGEFYNVDSDCLIEINGYYYNEYDDGICFLEDISDWGLKDDNYYCSDGYWHSTYYAENEDNGVYYHTFEDACDDAYQHRDGYWYSEEEDMYVENYHENKRTVFEEEIVSGWAFGIEFEKQDYYVKESCYTYDIPIGWRKEYDGSLDGTTGFEFVTPCYDLFSDKFKDDVEGNHILKRHINASLFCENTDEDNKYACGGHISISKKGVNNVVLMNKLSGSFPLLYALYNGRLNNTYCKAYKKECYKGKRAAVNISDVDERLEFRLFSGCPDLKTALWRIDLMRIIVKQFYGKSEEFVYDKMRNPRTKIYKHLIKVYSVDSIKTKCELFVKFAKEYGDGSLPA